MARSVQSDPDDQTDTPPALPEQEATSTDTSQKALILWLVGFVLQLKSKHNIPDKAVNLLFKY